MPATEPASLPVGRFVGRSTFRAWLLQGLQAANRQGWRELILMDPDFRDWPLDHPAWLQALGDWALPGRHLVLVAGSYQALPQQAPRFVRWRRHQTHLMHCLQVDVQPEPLPSLFWSAGWALRRHNLRDHRGHADVDGWRCARLRELAESWMEEGAPAFPPDTLGL